jgi:glycosyltransferase involved in cell wall biosynthesis
VQENNASRRSEHSPVFFSLHFWLNRPVTSVRKLRVWHVITRLIVGGAQENTVTTVLGLAAKPDLAVRLISGLSRGPEGSLQECLQSDLLQIVPELVRPIHPWKDCRALVRLAGLFRQDRPDIVHTHSGKAGILGRMAARRVGVPLIVHTIHGPSFGNFQSSLPNQIFRAAERHVARYTDHFVSVAEAMTRQYLAAGIGRAEQFTRIFSGFELEPFLTARNDPALRKQLGLAPDHFVIVKLARLSPLKGHDDLFAAAEKLIPRCPQARFLLVGDGPLRAEFERKLAARGIDRHFVFAGLVLPSRVPALLGLADVVVHLSAREGLARALPQAMAAGKPVISCNLDGAPEVCFDGKTGFLVEPNDFGQIAERLLRLASDQPLRVMLGEAGREFVRQRFSAPAMVDAIHDLYLRLSKSAGVVGSAEPR